MTIQAIVIPPRYPELQVLQIGNSEKEKEILIKTGFIFDSKPDLKANHYLIANGNDFAGILEFTVKNDSKNGTAVIKELWINSNQLLSFLEGVYLNLGLNFDKVNIMDSGMENTFIVNADPIDNFNPMLTSSVKVVDLENDSNGRISNLLKNF
ncbi:MAG: hypothetical protein HXM94_01345 [Parvimonas micra]|uniref:Uncharacterized protein n=1 Tax=Parvimonas micra TaxID=33033 RepID=A0A930E241_9FIRM|nr:hypothetical protein [Parvimonas micra]MBF1306422.1 hypothetical protein [Parvimonas micra]